MMERRDVTRRRKKNLVCGSCEKSLWESDAGIVFFTAANVRNRVKCRRGRRNYSGLS